MNNEELCNDIMKLRIMVSDLRSIVIGQCATILDLLDENREIKKLLANRKNNNDEREDNYARCLIMALENMYDHECKFSNTNEGRK